MTDRAVRPTDETINAVVAAIYESALTPERWTDVLGRLRDMFGLALAVSVTRNRERTVTDGQVAGMDLDEYQRFLHTLFPRSPFLAREQEWCAGQVIRSRDVVPHRIFKQTELYQGFWRPNGLHEGLRLIISDDACGTHHFINLIRARTARAFGQPDIAVARTLMPHLRRAAQVGQRLRQADALASAALATLDVLPHALLLLDHATRLIHANAAGRAMLAAADALSARHGILHGASPGVTNQLHTLLTRAAGGGGVSPRAGALRLPKAAGANAQVMIVIPFRSETAWSLSRAPAVLVTVTDPDANRAVLGRPMMELFGLTVSEAALAGDLLSGLELREIAARRGRSINTVRTQLARLMAKTDVNRQSELIRLLAGLPRAGTEA